MDKNKTRRVKALLRVIETLEKHPALVKLFLRPAANAPVLSRALKVLPRAYMGATAFEIHDVDLDKGRIAIGGVEEIMFGAKIIHLLHTVLAEKLGAAEKDQTLYEIGFNLCRWEVTQALESGKWAPRVLVPLIHHAKILDEVQQDPLMARFFEKTMNMMSRLITDEGGWGHLEFDVRTVPLKVSLSNSQEAAWLGPSDKPVCSLYAGIVAGYASTISGETLLAREIQCKAMGADKCVFAVERNRTK